MGFGFDRFRGTWLGVPIIRLIVFCGLYEGRPFWETTICCMSGF